MKDKYVALLLTLSMLVGSASAAIYYVDDDAINDVLPFDREASDPNEDGSEDHPFDGIQEAIDAATDGDTIIVAPGQYLSLDTWAYDEINFNGKSIHLVSSAPTDFSVIDETVLCGVVIFEGTETSDCLLQGFKIQNYSYGGILGNDTQARISHCIISGNGPCGATVVQDCKGTISNCLIVDNTTFHDCGTLPVVSGCTEFINCTIANNLTGVDMIADTPTVRNCIIHGNQTSQTVSSGVTRGGALSTVSYSLIEDSVNSTYGVIDTDPCFVQLGAWVEMTGSTPTRSGGVTRTTTTEWVLVEGDYHLKTAGWRWSPQPIHGWHWYFDTVTSAAIDAGYPLDGLGEELERAPDDPEGLWGVNHAINLGAYGGTTQASLAPTVGEAPGIGAVDLQDYWPIDHVGNRWSLYDAQTIRYFYVSSYVSDSDSSGQDGTETYYISYYTSDGTTRFDCYYGERTLRISAIVGASRGTSEQISDEITTQYPQFPVVGTAIEIPYDPFVRETSEYRSVLVLRGTLADVLDGTSMDPNQILTGSWPDVIAFKEISEDGTTGDIIAIFARGFGPLWISGHPVAGAIINSEQFGSVTSSATRG